MDLLDDTTGNPGELRPRELEAVYGISRAVAQAVNMDTALDEIVRLSRPVFIFDTMVLYLPAETGVLDARYARIIGRGQSAEGELSWGEVIANETYRTGQSVFHKEETKGWQENRLGLHYLLGLPLRAGDRLIGAVVFLRFGGPTYTPDQIHLAEFIVAHVAQLLVNKQLLDRVANLEAERRLDQLQKDFIATISHELCTPLGFIKGYATTLLREDTTWDELTRREFLTIIDEEADKLRELIDNLLDSSRLQSGTLHMQLQPVRMDTLLRDVAIRASSSHEKLKIDLDVQMSDLRCSVDPTRLAQVLDNLLSNAVKYAPGSPVTLLLEPCEDQKIHIAVSDSGPGIAPEHIEHLFKRFYRVPEHSASTRGTGLGLFICRQIVQAHDGEITVQSELGRGTTFHIYLPCKPVDPGNQYFIEEATS